MPTVYSIGSASAQGFGNQLPTGQYPVFTPFSVGLVNTPSSQLEISTLDSSGNLIFACVANNALNIYKYDSTTVFQWKYKYYQTAVWQLLGCVTDSSDNIYALIGDTSTGYTTYTVIKIDPNGAFVTAYNMSTANASYIARPYVGSIKTDSSNNIYVTGYWSTLSGNLYVSFVLKLNSSLAQVWYYSYTFQPTPTFYADTARDICVDSNGNVFVFGNTYNSTTGGYAEYYVMKLTSSGSFSAGCKFSAAATNLNASGSIFVDSSNNVYFTVSSIFNGPTYVKLNNSLTSVLSQKYLNTTIQNFSGGYNPNDSRIYTVGQYYNGTVTGAMVSSVDTSFSNLKQCFFAVTPIGTSTGVYLNGVPGTLSFSTTNITFGCWFYDPDTGINPTAALNYFTPSYLTTSGTKYATISPATFTETGNYALSTILSQSLTFTSGLTASPATVALTYTSATYNRAATSVTLGTNSYT